MATLSPPSGRQYDSAAAAATGAYGNGSAAPSSPTSPLPRGGSPLSGNSQASHASSAGISKLTHAGVGTSTGSVTAHHGGTSPSKVSPASSSRSHLPPAPGSQQQQVDQGKSAPGTIPRKSSSRRLHKSPSNHSLTPPAPSQNGSWGGRARGNSGASYHASAAGGASDKGSRRLSNRAMQNEGGMVASGSVGSLAIGATPSFPVSSPDAFDAVVQASNPMHPDHAAYIERFGTLSRSKMSRSSSQDLHQAAGVQSVPASLGYTNGQAAASSSSVNPGTTRSRRSASKSSQHSGYRPRAADVLSPLQPTQLQVQNDQHTPQSPQIVYPNESDRDSDDAALVASVNHSNEGGMGGPASSSLHGGAGGSAREDGKQPGTPLSPTSSSIRRPRRRRQREASGARSSDKGKGKAPSPPVPPPRVTSSTTYMATVGLGSPSVDGSSAPPTPMMTSHPYSSAAPSPMRTAFPTTESAVGRSSFSASRPQSIDMPRVAVRTSSIGDSARPNLEELMQGRQPQPPVPALPEWVAAPSPSGLPAPDSASIQSTSSRHDVHASQAEVNGSLRRSNSVRSHTGSLQDSGAGSEGHGYSQQQRGPYGVSAMPSTLNGRPTEGRHLSTVYQEDTEAGDEFFDANDDSANAPGGSHSKPTPIPTIVQQSAGRIPYSSLSGLGIDGQSPSGLAVRKSNSKDENLSNGSRNSGKRRSSDRSKLLKSEAASSSKHSASFHSYTSSNKGTSPPLKDMSDFEKKQFLASNTYYIPPASRSPSSGNSSPQPPPPAASSGAAMNGIDSSRSPYLDASENSRQAASNGALRPATSSPNLFRPSKHSRKKSGATGTSGPAGRGGKPTSEAGFSTGAASAKTTGAMTVDYGTAAGPGSPGGGVGSGASSRRGSFWGKLPGFRSKNKTTQEQLDANFTEFAASIGLYKFSEQPLNSQNARRENNVQGAAANTDSPLKGEHGVAAPDPATVLANSTSTSTMATAEESSWRARLLPKSTSSKTSVGSPRAASKSISASSPQEADKWRHDILSEAVTRSLVGASSSGANVSTPPNQTNVNGSGIKVPTSLADVDFPEETTKKSLSPRLLSDEVSTSREATWRSMAVNLDEQSEYGVEQKIPNGFTEEANIPTSTAAEAIPKQAPEATLAHDTNPSGVSVTPRVPAAGKSQEHSPSLQTGRTSFSQDRNREPVMSPLLRAQLAQQQNSSTSGKSQGLFGALKDRLKSPRNLALGSPIESSAYQSMDMPLSPVSSKAALPSLPGSPEPPGRPAVGFAAGLGIEESGSEAFHATSTADDEPSSPLYRDGISAHQPPKPPAKLSADVKAFDEMLKGFGQADREVRQNITMRVGNGV